MGSHKLSQGQDLEKASITPLLCSTIQNWSHGSNLQGRLGHVVLPTCLDTPVRWVTILPVSATSCICHTGIPTWLFPMNTENTNVLSKRVNTEATQYLDSASIQVMHGLFLLVKQPILFWAHNACQHALLRFFLPIPSPRAHYKHGLPSKCSPEILPNNFLVLYHPLTE